MPSNQESLFFKTLCEISIVHMKSEQKKVSEDNKKPALEKPATLEATIFGDYDDFGENFPKNAPKFDPNAASTHQDLIERLQNSNFQNFVENHPKRGTFNLEAALRDSREKGYGKNLLQEIIHYYCNV